MQLLIVIIVIYYFSRQKTNYGGGNSKANDAPFKSFLVIFPLGILAIIFSVSFRGSALFLVPLTLVVLLPSWWAQIFIRLGWVQTSFWLGYLARAVHTRDPFGGALFYGWLALQKAPKDQRGSAKEFLEKQLYVHSGSLGSGAMVMQVLMKYDGENDKDLMEMLRLFSGCNKLLVPGNISRYACRFMLARDIPTGDWWQINFTAGQWHGAGINPLAGWLQVVYWDRGKRSLRLEQRIKYLLAGMPSFAKLLPPLLPKTAKVSPLEKFRDQSPLDALKLAEWEIHEQASADRDLLNQAWHKYSESDLLAQWRPRLQELGDYNPDESCAMIKQSLRDFLAMQQGGDAMESDFASQERDRQYTLLRIKINAVNRRVSSKKWLGGAYEFEEWLAMALIARRLNQDPMSESQIYHLMRNCCWNWMAGLWNDAKCKPLAFMIASFMAPMAMTMSDTDAYNSFSGIVTNKIK